ncbi:hypothetical protein C4577_07915 [Candidatus Parcubacteria bacterium]|nr:MAG: hypothetical protein C4577_07915 [Candidatus Parcubacteria bacterium]
MIIYLIFLFLAIFISLFVLYVLSKNDFILLRKGITLLNVFNITFISLFFAFISGRVFYILDNFDPRMLDVLNFFHILKYPGFSVLEGFIGGLLVLFFKRYSEARLRVADILTLSFFSTYYFFVISSFDFGKLWIVKMPLLIFLLVMYFLLLNSHKNYKLRDGSIALVIIALISLVGFIDKGIIFNKNILELHSVSQVISIILFIVSFILIIFNQRVIGRRRR